MSQIREAVALLAAAVATVYMLGALVLALRLQTNDLPTLGVLANLPRELVISVGLTYVVVPWLLAAAAVAGVWLVREGSPAAPESRRLLTGTEAGRAVAVAVVAVALAWIVLWLLEGPFTRWDAAALGLAAAATAMLANVGWRLLSRRHAAKWRKPTAVGVSAALAGLVVVPLFVEIGARSPLPEAQLCGEGPTHLRGWLVGEAGNRVYIGESTDPHRIVSAPRTGELYVGPDAHEPLLCRAERALAPTADQLVAAAFDPKTCPKCSGGVSAIRVSGRRPWLAAAFAFGVRGETRFQHEVLFRRTDSDWRVVALLPRSDVPCDALEGRTGVSAAILGQDLRVCDPRTERAGARSNE